MGIQSGEAKKLKLTRNTLIFNIVIAASTVVLSTQPAGALRSVSAGSAIAIAPDGFIIKNFHVVTMGVKYRQGGIVGESVCGGVSVKGAGHYGRVRIVAGDRIMDLAVVKLGSKKNRPTVRAETRGGTRRFDEYKACDQNFFTVSKRRTGRDASSRGI